MAQRTQVIEVFAPSAGRKHDAPSTMLDPRSQPDGMNGKMYYGVNQKEYGTSLFATGTGSVLNTAVTFLYNALFPNVNLVQAYTNTHVYKYTASGDTFVNDGQTFTGSAKDYWNGVMYNDQFFYTNGIDPIQVKPAPASTGTSLASALSPATYMAWAVSAFREHLNLYHTIEGGTEFFKRVRWSKKGTLVLSAGTTDFATGLAGAIDIPEAEGEIKTAVPLGVTEAIYCARCIIIQNWVGGDEVYRFTKTVSGIGTPSRRGALSRGDINYFIGNDSFYSYAGGDDYRDIGEPIKSRAWAEINQSALGTAFVEYDEVDNEVLYHVPIANDTSPSIVWVYRLENQSWTRQQRSFTAVGQASGGGSQKTIGELMGTIGDQNWRYSDFGLQAGANQYLYGQASGHIVKKDRSLFSVSVSGTATAQSFAFITPDLTASVTQKQGQDPYDKNVVDYRTTKKRFNRFAFEAIGNGQASVLYSTDQGVSYTTFPESPVTLAVNGTQHELYFDLTTEQIRYQVANTGINDTIGIKAYETDYVVGANK